MATLARTTSIFEKNEYKPNRHHGIPRRIASYLDWCADARPGTFIPYPEIAQHVLGVKTPLNAQSKLTHVVRDELYRARDLMMSLYGQDILTNGTGARATVDASELFRFRLGHEMTRLSEQLSRYGRTARLIEENPLCQDDQILEHAHKAAELAADLETQLRELVDGWNALAEARALPPRQDAGEPRLLAA